MKALFRRIARDAAAPIEQMGVRLVKTAALFFLAAACLLIATVFLTIDLYLFLQTLAGSVIAALSVGGLYLAFALICFAIAVRGSRNIGEAAVSAPVEAAPARAEPSPEFAANVDGAVAPILDVLRDAGLQRERLAVEAGAAIVKQLNPLALVAFSIVAGIVLGRMLGNARPSGDGAAPPSNKDAV